MRHTWTNQRENTRIISLPLYVPFLAKHIHYGSLLSLITGNEYFNSQLLLPIDKNSTD